MSSKYIYSFSGIELTCKEIKKHPGQAFKGKFFNFDLNTESKVIIDQGVLAIGVSIRIRDEDSTEYSAFFEVFAIFKVEELAKWAQTTENGSVIVIDELENELKKEAISTSRGIIYSELRGTYLNGAVLPIVDPTIMVRIPKDLSA